MASFAAIIPSEISEPSWVTVMRVSNLGFIRYFYLSVLRRMAYNDQGFPHTDADPSVSVGGGVREGWTSAPTPFPTAGNPKLYDVGRPPRRPWMVAADQFFCISCLFTLIKISVSISIQSFYLWFFLKTHTLVLWRFSILNFITNFIRHLYVNLSVCFKLGFSFSQ